MAPRLLLLAAGLAPPSWRRAAAGALLDLKSLPARIADPERRGDPWAAMHNVGNGDYRVIGAQIVGSLAAHAGLGASDHVLDIGCGTGRAAGPLAPILRSGGGHYVGFDVSRGAIRGCQRRHRDEPAMVFHHLDVWNGDYNRGGRIAESDARFPAEDASIDLAFAMSVFTHMRLAGVRCYLKEAARVLRPGGRVAFTVLALEPERQGPAIFDLQPFEETSAVMDPRSPERAIAHQRATLEQALVEVGLRPTIFRRGLWRPPADYDGGQDLIVAIKPERSSETIPRG